MKTYAEVINGIVTSVRTCEDDHTPESSDPLQFVMIVGEVIPSAGFIYDGEKNSDTNT